MSMYCTLALAGIATLGTVPAGITLELTTLSRAPYYPEIPILLQVSVTNEGDESLTIPTPTLSTRDNPYHTIEIYVGANPASLRPLRYVVPNFAPWKEGLPPEPPTDLILAAGASWKAVVPLSHDWQPEAARSLITGKQLLVEARLCGWADKDNTTARLDRENTRNSNTLNLPITPVSGAGATALQKLTRLEKPWLLAHPAAVAHVSQDRDFRAFQELARMSTSSPYTAWAQMVVAYMMAQGNALDLHGNRPPQPRVAAMWMDQALKNRGDTALHPEWINLKKQLDLVIATDTSADQTGNNAPS